MIAVESKTMRPGLWTGFYLLENSPRNIVTVESCVHRLNCAGFCCGELDERSAYALFVKCTDEEAVYNAERLAELHFFTQMHMPKPAESPKERVFCMERILRAAGKMGVHTLVTHPFVAYSFEMEPKKQNKDYLKDLVGMSEVSEIRIALENQIYPVDMDYYLDSVPGLGVNLDFAHAIASGQDVVYLIKKYKSVLYGLHVADSDGRKEDYHISPGKGVLEWKKVISALSSCGYSGDFHLETVHERSSVPEINDVSAQTIFKAVSLMLSDD